MAQVLTKELEGLAERAKARGNETVPVEVAIALYYAGLEAWFLASYGYCQTKEVKDRAEKQWAEAAQAYIEAVEGHRDG